MASSRASRVVCSSSQTSVTWPMRVAFAASRPSWPVSAPANLLTHRSQRIPGTCDEVAHHTNDQPGSLECGRLVGHAYLERAEPRVRACVPPDTRVVRHDAEPDEPLDPRFPGVVAAERGRCAAARELGEDQGS